MQDPHLSQKTFSQAHHPTKTREINGTETPHTIRRGLGLSITDRKGWIPLAGFWPRWLPKSGFPGLRKRIQRAKVVIPQVFDNESLFAGLTGRWFPGGFPGESACR